MEAIGCGCLLGIIIGIPVAILAWISASRQRTKLDSVDLESLSEGDRVRWQTYTEQLARNVPLCT